MSDSKRPSGPVRQHYTLATGGKPKAPVKSNDKGSSKKK